MNGLACFFKLSQTCLYFLGAQSTQSSVSVLELAGGGVGVVGPGFSRFSRLSLGWGGWGQAQGQARVPSGVLQSVELLSHRILLPSNFEMLLAHSLLVQGGVLWQEAPNWKRNVPNPLRHLYPHFKSRLMKRGGFLKSLRIQAGASVCFLLQSPRADLISPKLSETIPRPPALQPPSNQAADMPPMLLPPHQPEKILLRGREKEAFGACDLSSQRR